MRLTNNPVAYRRLVEERKPDLAAALGCRVYAPDLVAR